MAVERAGAVALMRRLERARELATGQPLRRALQRLVGRSDWPPASGAYVVADRAAPVAVCTLTDRELIRPAAALPGVAIAGRVATANLGLEKILLNVTSNPSIRFLLLCGRDSPLFHPGQTLVALAANGVDAERRVIGAEGYLPVLGSLPPALIERFREQVDVVDRIGQTDLAVLADATRELVARSPGPFEAAGGRLDSGPTEPERFVHLRPGGRRESLRYDPKGYFVITPDHEAGQIIVRHYWPDNAPAHEMRGRNGAAILLGLLRDGLVTQLSHAGYLGGGAGQGRDGAPPGARLRAGSAPWSEVPEMIVDAAQLMSRIVAGDPVARTDPYPVYRAAREVGPVVPWTGPKGGRNRHLLSYADVGASLVDRRLSSTPHAGGPAADRPDDLRRLSSLLLLLRDPPDHTRLRRLVAMAFTPRVVEASRGDIQAVLDELLVGVRGEDEVEIIAALADPLPARVIGSVPEIGLGPLRAVVGRAHVLPSGSTRGGGHQGHRRLPPPPCAVACRTCGCPGRASGGARGP